MTDNQLWAISWANHGGEGTGSTWSSFDEAADRCYELGRKYPDTSYRPERVVPAGSRDQITKGAEVFLKHPNDCPEGVIVMYWCSLNSPPHIGYRNKKALRERLPGRDWVDYGSVKSWSHRDVVGWIYCPTPVIPRARK